MIVVDGKHQRKGCGERWTIRPVRYVPGPAGKPGGRTAGRLPDAGRLQVAKVMRHEWEAGWPGRRLGLFFPAVPWGCLYCQNEEISAGGFGREMSAPALRRTMEELIAQGAENIDLVTPTHFLPDILPGSGAEASGAGGVQLRRL